MEDVDEASEDFKANPIFYLFSEHDEVRQLIIRAKTLSDCQFGEKDYERMKYVVNQYKEQPHLLDKGLHELIEVIISIIQNEEVPFKNKHLVFKYLFLLTNVRGFKKLVQKLPHTAQDLEPVLTMLEKQNEKDPDTWETRYSLLLWLSIIVKIPFDLSRLDPAENPNGFKTVSQRLYDSCLKYLMVSDINRDAASFLCGHFLTRSDVKDVYLKDFFHWAFKIINNKEENWNRLGPLKAVAIILKLGKRADLLPHAPWLLKETVSFQWNSEPFRLCRKLALKIIQRIGLTFLKARVLSWRYNRGRRRLEDILGNQAAEGEGDFKKDFYEEEEEDVVDIPEQIEEIIEELLQGLRDQDITIRWSAAKGIGRVVGRMSRTLADEVIGCVMELLTPREGDSAWHGGCLALAELGKRGLLIPSRLNEVVPLIKKALVYDEPRGYSSVGSHVRDAACYVTWSFARAYDSHVFKPFVNDIASSLVVVTCFDREINVRRAAAAAFQEHIGRQGTFPHGIEITTEADFFSVGVRNNSYLNISVYIAQFGEYTIPLIEHLAQRKIGHWDCAIRELAGKALHNLTPRSPSYMLEIMLPLLISNIGSLDVNVRHGSIMSIGEIIYALSLMKFKVSKTTYSLVSEIVSQIRNRGQFKSLSGELMKLACCHLIHKCSLAKAPFREQRVIVDWQNLIDECICHEVINIRLKACEALTSLCAEYYCQTRNDTSEKCRGIVHSYTDKLLANDEVIRIGHAQALGSLPVVMLEGNVSHVVERLIRCSQITESTEKWVESRRHSIKALTSICTTIGLSSDDPHKSCRPHVLAILECFVEGLNDYTKDDRGDTGAWVRESCMSGLQNVVLMAATHCPEVLNELIIRRIMCNVTQQAVERIDRTRALAGKVFSALLHHSPDVPFIPERDAVVIIFPEDECKKEINWLSNDTFPRFTEMLKLHTYTYSLMNGLISSIGGLTESLVKASSTCLFTYLKYQALEELKFICDITLEIYQSNMKVDRIVLPMLSFLELLFTSGSIRPVLECHDSRFALSIFETTKIILTGCLEKYKLLGSVDVYCQLIQVRGEVCRRTLKRLMLLLCHKFAWVRKATASKMYEALLLYAEETEREEEVIDTVLTILSDTEWSTAPLEDVRKERNKISELFGIPPPLPVVKQN